MYVDNPKSYNRVKYVVRTNYPTKDGKTFVRLRLQENCEAPPPGFACYPDPDPCQNTYRQELMIPERD
ncbi:hypothetical protein F4802DRAFT_230428 [Xylaria palmicola]|nr:hypothetical protein F4802DRAFT_230428 [Xylaria palmicola]